MSIRIAGFALVALAVPISAFAQQKTSDDGDAHAITEILHIFTGVPDGIYPAAGLTIGKNGVLYGTTEYGGNSPQCTDPFGCGTVFELTPPPFVGAAWSEKVIYSFTIPFSYPQAAPTIGPDGVLYGTTYAGGANSTGNVYRLRPPPSPGGTWTETDLYDLPVELFIIQNPVSELVIGNDGVLYGTTQHGGFSESNCQFFSYFDYGCGAVFSLTPPATPGGAWTPQTIYTFNGPPDGTGPLTKLVLGKNGELYGTTYYGGSSFTCLYGEIPMGCGTVFVLRPPALPGGNWQETVVYNFTGGRDGGFPNSLTYREGVFYGSVTFGGDPKNCGGFGCGGIFELRPPATAGGAWKERVIYSFIGGRNGLYPGAGPVIDSGGNLYGTTRDGGHPESCPANPGCGTVFELTPPRDSGTAWQEQVLHRFTSDEGRLPTADLVIGSDGALYGTTLYGGPPCVPDNQSPYGCGVVFEVRPSAQCK